MTSVSSRPVPHPAASADELRALVSGPILTPNDADYDQARALYFAGTERRPAIVVRPVDATEVARVVRFAADTGTELAVRGGGHGLARHASIDGGIVLDLRGLRDLDLDVEGRTAWTGTGLTTGEYTAAAGAHGLATGFGDAGTVGIGGLTVGGGVGLLTRLHGLTIDQLLAAEVVTADGTIHHVDADHEPDLFWAIRGGGGNVGVVTRLHFRLHEVAEVVGGILVLPLTTDVVAGFVAAAMDAPEELTTIALATAAAPPLPFLPPEAHGKSVLIVLLAHVGDATSGERAVAPIRALAEPLADLVAPQPYPDLFPPEQEDGPHLAAVAETRFLDHVDTDTANTILTHLDEGTAPMSVVQIRVLGGAVARVPADATAYAHRDAAILANVAALFEDPAEADTHGPWVRRTAAAIDQGRTGRYVNFLGQASEEVARAAWPGDTGRRLAEIKRRHDPDNLFRNTLTVPTAT